MTFSACRSSWICASALWLALPVAEAQEALAVRPADRELVSSEPRQVVATMFMVRNLSGAPMEVETHLELPPGWQAVTPAMQLALTSGESAMRLVSFTIPEGASAGDHAVVFSARDRLRPAVADSATLRVRVLAAHHLSLAVLDVPDFAVAGERIAAGVVFRNSGNAAMTVDYQVTGRQIARATPAQGTLRLEPAQTRRVDLEIELDDVRERATARISVETAIAGVQARESVSSTLQLVPRAGPLDALRTLASRVETRFVARDTRDGRRSGWQAALAGGGMLDEQRGDILRYSLRGPDGRQSGSFGAAEEYWLRYDTRHWSLGAGDITYGLTPLTEPGRLGRGASLAWSGKTWNALAYGMRDSFGGALRQSGASVNLRPSSGAALGLNFLDRGATGDLWTLRTQSTLESGAELDLELGRSRARDAQGGALRFAVRGKRNTLGYYAAGWSADEDFLGPLRDKAYLSAGFDLADAGGWTWRGYYRLQNWNLTPLAEIDPDQHASVTESQRMRVMPAERQAGVGTGHALGEHLAAALDLVWRHRDARRGGEDLSPMAEQQSASWRAGLTGSWRRFSLQYSRERGRAETLNTGAGFDTSTQMLSASWRVDWLSCNAYWMRDKHSQLDSTDPERTARGVNASLAYRGFSLNADLQSSEARFGRSAIGVLSLAHQSESGGRWTLAARRMDGRFARSDYFLSYSLPFRLPVMPRRDVAVIRGRVFDAETQAGLRDVVLRMDGRAAVTNARGEFRFPGVSPGAHPILIDQSQLAIDQVPASDAPREFTVSGRPAAPLLIAMQRSVEIRVRVVTTEEPHSPARAAAGALVSFRNGDLVVRRLTDADGEARIGGVPPGSWVVAVDDETLPSGLRPDRKERVLQLTPGGKAQVEFLLAPERRVPRMQAPLAVR